MPLAGFEPTIPVFKRTKTFKALDRPATVTGTLPLLLIINKNLLIMFCEMNTVFMHRFLNVKADDMCTYVYSKYHALKS
jgi:hypothetical protein